jgi:hypothetical protein
VKRTTYISLHLNIHRASVSEALGVVSIKDKNLLSMITTVKAAEHALRSKGIQLGPVNRDDGSRLHFSATVEDAENQEKHSPSAEVERRIVELRSNASSGEATRPKDHAGTPEEPHNGGSDEVDSGGVGGRMAPLLSKCPAFVEVEGRTVALGVPNEHLAHPTPPNPAQLSYDCIATEEHLVSQEQRRYRCTVHSGVPNLDSGATLTIRIAREARERMADEDDIERQIGFDFGDGP